MTFVIYSRSNSTVCNIPILNNKYCNSSGEAQLLELSSHPDFVSVSLLNDFEWNFFVKGFPISLKCNSWFLRICALDKSVSFVSSMTPFLIVASKLAFLESNLFFWLWNILLSMSWILLAAAIRFASIFSLSSSWYILLLRFFSLLLIFSLWVDSVSN